MKDPKFLEEHFDPHKFDALVKWIKKFQNKSFSSPNGGVHKGRRMRLIMAEWYQIYCRDGACFALTTLRRGKYIEDADGRSATILHPSRCEGSFEQLVKCAGMKEEGINYWA